MAKLGVLAVCLSIKDVVRVVLVGVVVLSVAVETRCVSSVDVFEEGAVCLLLAVELIGLAGGAALEDLIVRFALCAALDSSSRMALDASSELLLEWSSRWLAWHRLVLSSCAFVWLDELLRVSLMVSPPLLLLYFVSCFVFHLDFCRSSSL